MVLIMITQKAWEEHFLCYIFCHMFMHACVYLVKLQVMQNPIMKCTKGGDRMSFSVSQGSKAVFLVATLFCVFASLINIGDSNVPVLVNRRSKGDIYVNFNSTELLTCHHENNLTFLVDERRCVKNQELFNGN